MAHRGLNLWENSIMGVSDIAKVIVRWTVVASAMRYQAAERITRPAREAKPIRFETLELRLLFP